MTWHDMTWHWDTSTNFMHFKPPTVKTFFGDGCTNPTPFRITLLPQPCSWQSDLHLPWGSRLENPPLYWHMVLNLHNLHSFSIKKLQQKTRSVFFGAHFFCFFVVVGHSFQCPDPKQKLFHADLQLIELTLESWRGDLLNCGLTAHATIHEVYIYQISKLIVMKIYLHIDLYRYVRFST